MSIKYSMFTKDKVICQNTGLFLIRFGLGLVFVVHGWQKLSDIGMIVGFFNGLGLPAIVAYVVAVIELLGGLAMICGVWTKCAGWLLAIVMAGAIILVKGKMGFIGGYELDLLLFLTALGIAFTGPGTGTVHRLMGRTKE